MNADLPSPPTEQGQQDILYGCIDREAVSALNEATPGSSKRIIKPYNERNDETLALASDADDQLILTIPFTGPVKLRTLLLKAGPGAQTPAKLHLYANKADLDFDDANAGVPKPTQSLESIAETREVVEVSGSLAEAALRFAELFLSHSTHCEQPSSQPSTA